MFDPYFRLSNESVVVVNDSLNLYKEATSIERIYDKDNITIDLELDENGKFLRFTILPFEFISFYCPIILPKIE